MAVFPARAGMSPSTDKYTGLSGGVPRASGDEPNMVREKDYKDVCSPRERG